MLKLVLKNTYIRYYLPYILSTCGLNYPIYKYMSYHTKKRHKKYEKKSIQIAKFQFDFSPQTSLMKNVNFSTFFHFVILCDDDNKA